MKKILLELLATVGLFAGIWFLAAQVDWIKVLRVEKVSRTTEDKLGELLQKIMVEKEISTKQIYKPVDSLLSHLCKENGIARKQVKLHVVRNAEINAFAMPGGHLVVYTGLIEACTHPDQLAGVIAHEVAHLQKRHVMKKLIKELGLSALLSAAGGTGGEVIKEAMRHLSSTAYDRELEKEADLTAIQYLENAGLSALPFGEFMYLLATEGGMPRYLEWVSTHPDSEARAAYIQEAADDQIESLTVIQPETWVKMKRAIENQ